MKHDFQFLKMIEETLTAIKCHELNGKKHFSKETYIEIDEIFTNLLTIYKEELMLEIDKIKLAFISGQNCPKTLMNCDEWLEKNFNNYKK
jgi:hypothetical protein